MDAQHSSGPDSAHRRPAGLDDATVTALGKLSEALETVEHARGLLYGFHRLTGAADLALGEAVDLLRTAGHDGVAERIEADLVGRNVIEGRWTFQIVEEYDDTYYSVFREHERAARDELAGGRRHLFEAEMKEDRRTPGRAHHGATPGDETQNGETQDTETQDTGTRSDGTGRIDVVVEAHAGPADGSAPEVHDEGAAAEAAPGRS